MAADIISKEKQDMVKLMSDRNTVQETAKYLSRNQRKIKIKTDFKNISKNI